MLLLRCSAKFVFSGFMCEFRRNFHNTGLLLNTSIHFEVHIDNICLRTEIVFNLLITIIYKMHKITLV